MRVFKAFGTKGSVVAETARDAAIAFFEEHPSARKCDVCEGYLENGRFILVLGKGAGFRADGITKKMVHSL